MVNKTAKAAANYVTDNMFEAHRGAIWWTDNIVAIFGNDGYQGTEWVKKEVAILRQLVKAQGMKVRGFAVDDDDGYSWVLLVDAPTCKCRSSTGELFRQQLWSMHHNDLVWQAWREAVGGSGSPGLGVFEAVQRSIADEVITAKEQPITDK